MFHVNMEKKFKNTGKSHIFARKKYESSAYHFPYFRKNGRFSVFTEIREYESL